MWAKEGEEVSEGKISWWKRGRREGEGLGKGEDRREREGKRSR